MSRFSAAPSPIRNFTWTISGRRFYVVRRCKLISTLHTKILLVHRTRFFRDVVQNVRQCIPWNTSLLACRQWMNKDFTRPFPVVPTPCTIQIHFLKTIGTQFKFGTVVLRPEKLRFSNLIIMQFDHCTSAIDAKDKLNDLDPAILTCLRWKAVTSSLSGLKKAMFALLNSSFGCLYSTVSLFCSVASAQLQKCLPDAQTSNLITQNTFFQELKSSGTTIQYGRPSDKREYLISALVFADARWPSDRDQLSKVRGLLIGMLCRNSYYHVINWSSHKSKRSVFSIAAVEILAASGENDWELLLQRPMLNCMKLKWNSLSC